MLCCTSAMVDGVCLRLWVMPYVVVSCAPTGFHVQQTELLSGDLVHRAACARAIELSMHVIECSAPAVEVDA